MFSKTLSFIVWILIFHNSIQSQSPHMIQKTFRADSSRIEHPVRQLFLSSIEAFNENELDTFLSNFSEDITMYGTDGVYKGIDHLRKRFSTVIKQFPNKKMEIPYLQIEELADHVVIVHFNWTLYPMGKGPSYRGQGSGIYVNGNDGWKEILEIETVTEIDPVLMQDDQK